MLFVKKCQSIFQERGKKTDTLLPVQRRRDSNGGRPETSVVGDTLELQTPLTSGFFSQEAPWPLIDIQVCQSSRRISASALSGARGGICSQQLEYEGRRAVHMWVHTQLNQTLLPTWQGQPESQRPCIQAHRHPHSVDPAVASPHPLYFLLGS